MHALRCFSHQYEVVDAPRLVHVGQGEQELQQVAQRWVQIVGAGLSYSSLLTSLSFFVFITGTAAATLTFLVRWLRSG